jgi:hypothetical protein
MGFYFRKRLGLGPLALNFSRTGVGISAGVRSLRRWIVVISYPQCASRALDGQSSLVSF